MTTLMTRRVFHTALLGAAPMAAAQDTPSSYDPARLRALIARRDRQLQAALATPSYAAAERVWQTEREITEAILPHHALLVDGRLFVTDEIYGAARDSRLPLSPAGFDDAGLLDVPADKVLIL